MAKAIDGDEWAVSFKGTEYEVVLTAALATEMMEIGRGTKDKTLDPQDMIARMTEFVKRCVPGLPMEELGVQHVLLAWRAINELCGGLAPAKNAGGPSEQALGVNSTGGQ